MKFKVRYAKLHTPYFSNGTGNLGDVLDPMERHKGMELYYAPEGLYASYKGVHFVVPTANVVGATFFSDPFPKEAALPQEEINHKIVSVNSNKRYG